MKRRNLTEAQRRRVREAFDNKVPPSVIARDMLIGKRTVNDWYAAFRGKKRKSTVIAGQHHRGNRICCVAACYAPVIKERRVCEHHAVPVHHVAIVTHHGVSESGEVAESDVRHSVAGQVTVEAF